MSEAQSIVDCGASDCRLRPKLSIAQVGLNSSATWPSPPRVFREARHCVFEQETPVEQKTPAVSSWSYLLKARHSAITAAASGSPEPPSAGATARWRRDVWGWLSCVRTAGRRRDPFDSPSVRVDKLLPGVRVSVCWINSPLRVSQADRALSELDRGEPLPHREERHQPSAEGPRKREERHRPLAEGPRKRKERRRRSGRTCRRA